MTTVNQLSMDEVQRKLGNYASYYEDPPTIEVFSYGNEKQAKTAYKEVRSKFEGNKALVEYEELSDKHYRLLIRVKDVSVDKVIEYAKMLSEYGTDEYQPR